MRNTINKKISENAFEVYRFLGYDKNVVSFVVSFFAKEYQGIPRTKIKNVDLTTFHQFLQKNAKE